MFARSVVPIVEKSYPLLATDSPKSHPFFEKTYLISLDLRNLFLDIRLRWRRLYDGLALFGIRDGEG